MATNADEQGADNTDQDAEDILRSSKYPKDEVETSKEEDETSDGEETEEDTEADGEDDGQTDDEAEGDKDSEEKSKEEDSEDEDLFVKKFPNIKGENLPEYTKTLEEAYDNSTSEAMKWKKRAEEAEAKLGSDDKDSDKEEQGSEDATDPLKMWAQQNLDKEVSEAYDDFVKIYPQATEEANYEKFKEEVATLSQTILTRQKRLASPRELYTKAAVILGWKPTETQPTKGERLKSALKDGAAIPKTTSGTKKRPKSNVTDGQIAVYRKMNPNDNKSDADIRKELEEYS